MTDPSRRPSPKPGSAPARRERGGQDRSSHGPSGSPRAGRRETVRRRHDEPTLLERFRTPLLALVVAAVVVGVGLFVFTSAAAPSYACTTVDSVQSPLEGELGQVQLDQGSQHVSPGEKVTFPVCPPASGKHLNRTGFGPLEPQVYGPDDQSSPAGWVHNLEHGGLVLLYSCEQGACDDQLLSRLEAFRDGFPASPVCGIPPGVTGPVVARFEEMPTPYAALLWSRVLYLETLDSAAIYEFFSRYGEVVVDGRFVAPPEQQCPVPSAAPEPSPAAS